MKGNVVIQLNDDDTYLVAAAVPINQEQAKVHHYVFSEGENDKMMAKVNELLEKIKVGYSAPRIQTIS